MMEDLNKIINENKEKIREKSWIFLKRNYLVIAVVILILLLLRQCNANNALKSEAKREHNNYLAAQDSVRLVSSKLGNAVYEKSAFELKMSELSQENKDLINKLDLSRSKTPEFVVETVTEYVDVFRDVPTKVEKDSSGQKMVSFIHNPELPGKNFLKISGQVPYDIRLDRNPNDPTLVSAALLPGSAQIEVEQKISIVSGIYRDPKTKRLMTRVSTDYPGITFSDINSFEVTDTPESRKALMGERRRFGLGVNAGFGYVVGTGGISPGAYVGIGLHFSPKFLQTDIK
jgi:hypothetical protein